MDLSWCWQTVKCKNSCIPPENSTTTRGRGAHLKTRLSSIIPISIFFPDIWPSNLLHKISMISLILINTGRSQVWDRKRWSISRSLNLPFLQGENGCVYSIFELHIICIPVHTKVPLEQKHLFNKLSNSSKIVLLFHRKVPLKNKVSLNPVDVLIDNEYHFILEQRLQYQGNHWREATMGDLFSRNVLALDTFLPIADAFHEKYDPDGSTCQSSWSQFLSLSF